MTPNSAHRLAKIIAEVYNRTFIDEFDAKVIENILQAELDEYYRMLAEYYEEEYYIAISRASSAAYDDGYDDGYDIGYDNGRSDSHSKCYSAV